MTRNGSRVTAVVDWTLRLVGVLSFVAVSLLYVNIQERTDCQARINEAQTARSRNLDQDLTRERNAARRVDDALAGIVAASLSDKPPLPAEARRLITELAAALASQARARQDADEARAANPPIPEQATRC